MAHSQMKVFYFWWLLLQRIDEDIFTSLILPEGEKWNFFSCRLSRDLSSGGQLLCSLCSVCPKCGVILIGCPGYF